MENLLIEYARLFGTQEYVIKGQHKLVWNHSVWNEQFFLLAFQRMKTLLNQAGNCKRGCKITCYIRHFKFYLALKNTIPQIPRNTCAQWFHFFASVKASYATPKIALCLTEPHQVYQIIIKHFFDFLLAYVLALSISVR